MSDGLEAVLAAHQLRWARPYSAACACGRWMSDSDAEAAHRTHLADAIRAAGWEKAPGRAERAEDAAVGASGGDVGSLGLERAATAIKLAVDFAGINDPIVAATNRGLRHAARIVRQQVTNGGCGDGTCNEEHGDMTTAATEESNDD